MVNPWDLPPLPTHGDDNEDVIFTAVGRVMTQWESIEFELARLYSTFVGKPDDYSALREYGRGRIFRDRLNDTKRAADAFFVTSSGQDVEGGFLEIETYTRGFSERRNDTAHGVVFKISGLFYFADRLDPSVRNKPQFALIPMLTTIRRHDDEWFPMYAYTSRELMTLHDSLVLLSHEISEFRLHLLR